MVRNQKCAQEDEENVWPRMIVNPYVTAIAVPIVLIFFTALVRKIVRGTSWIKGDFYLGVELSLGSITLALVNLIEISRADIKSNTNIEPNIIISNSVFLLLTLMFFLFVLALHQDWERRENNPKMQFLLLGIMCNALGVVLMSAFIVFVKGVI